MVAYFNHFRKKAKLNLKSIGFATLLFFQAGNLIAHSIFGDDFEPLDATELTAIKNYIASNPGKRVMLIRGQYDIDKIENRNIVNDDALGFAGLSLDNSETQGTATRVFALNTLGVVSSPSGASNVLSLPGDNASQGLVNILITANHISDLCDTNTSNTKKNFFGFANRQKNSAFPHTQLGGQAVCYDDGIVKFPVLVFYENLGGCGALFEVAAATGLNSTQQQQICAAAQGQAAKNHKSRGAYIRPASSLTLPDGTVRDTAITNGSAIYQAELWQDYYVTPGASVHWNVLVGAFSELSPDVNGKIQMKAGLTHYIIPFPGDQTPTSGGAVYENPTFQPVIPINTRLEHTLTSNTVNCSGGNAVLFGSVKSDLAGIKGFDIYDGATWVERIVSKPNATSLSYSHSFSCPVSGSKTYRLYTFDKIVNRSRDKIMGIAPIDFTITRN